MIEILRELFNFIKNPTDTRIENWSLQKNVKYFFAFLGFELIINLLIITPLWLLLNWVDPIITKLRIDYTKNTLLETLLVGIFLAPILEEYLFRYALRYNALFASIIKRNTWDKIFRYLVYFSIMAFGFLHGSNYINNNLLFYFLLPIIVCSQLLGGITITFLRVRFNLKSAILFHALWNTIVLLFLFAYSYFGKPYVKEEAHYTLKIESIKYNTKSGQKFTVEADSGKVYKASIKEYSLNHVLDSLFQYERKAEDQLLNLEVESKDGLSKEELKKELLTYGESQQDFF